MRIPTTISLFTASALLTVAATVAQPQTTPATPGTTTTTEDPSPTSSSSTGTLGDSSTTGTSSTGTSGGTGGYGTGTSSTGSMSGTGAAGTSGTSGTSGDGSSPSMTSGSMQNDASTSSTSSTASAGGASLQGTDAEFLRKAMQAGQEEVQNAQMAMQSAKRAETRNAASMMLEDHQRANSQLEQLVQQKGWSVPASAASAQSDQARSSSMSSGSGDFDSSYVTEEIRHHRDAISMYRAQASGGTDPDLRQFAKDNLPKLEHHLDMLENANTHK